MTLMLKLQSTAIMISINLHIDIETAFLYIHEPKIGGGVRYPFHTILSILLLLTTAPGMSTISSLNRFYSDKALGCTWDENSTLFRVFSPRATAVTCVLYNSVFDETGIDHPMKMDKDGVWEVELPGHYFGKYYGYRVDGPAGDGEMFDRNVVIADPYSKAVATSNDYLHKGKTLILDTSEFDWDGDTWLRIPQEDLVIYECHVRDLTAHPSSGVSSEFAGTYKGLIQPGIRGGLEHIKSLGVNAVEFLPVQDFGNIEIPYKKPVNGVTNTWNPYERNHWGYMTSYFFAPESYYATGQNLLQPGYSGIDGRQVNEFKEVVKAFHKEGIAVLMDVVYNHVSQYDQNCFKYLDKKYFFHLNPDNTFCSASGCGNDFKTDRPMVRRLIIDSIKFWMTEYHIDGFRFDLAAMIDWKTIDAITREARKINPNVILIAEAWGGGKYELAEFSKHDWASWNDQIRNGVKGQNPHDGQSFIFGKWFDKNNKERIKSYLTGTLAKNGGLYKKVAHSVNYLESHDDHTLGDFIRIGSGEVDPKDAPFNTDQLAVLSERQLRLNKLAALILFVSQGPVMIHEGQEWARSKVIAPTDAEDPEVGHIDHNSYNKDNETNWLNFDHAVLNSELVDFYRQLIQLRKRTPAFRQSPASAVSFIDHDNEFALGMQVKDGTSRYLVLLNADPEEPATFDLPAGDWRVAVSTEKIVSDTLRENFILAETTGIVLVNSPALINAESQ